MRDPAVIPKLRHVSRSEDPSVTGPVPNPQTMKRLAFIRLLYQQGLDQSRLAEPLTFTSVLSFHDAVELFLILTGEHLGATLADHIQFMKYWSELHPQKLPGGVDLSGKVAMDRLNRMRNAFKHAGTMPGLAAIEQARADVANFFEDNTPKVFGVAFDAIDMAEIVPQAQTRQKIKAATAANATGDRIEGMALLVEAFDELFEQHLGPHEYPPSPFNFGRNLSFQLRSHEIQSVLLQPPDQHGRMPARGAKRLAEEFETVREIAVAAQGALRVMVLGIDYRQYERFRLLTPVVLRTMNGEAERVHSPDYAPNEEEFDYCRQFVITVALRFVERQAHDVVPSWTVTHP
jgi:hypothetical protein